MHINKKQLFILLPFLSFITGYLISNFIIGNKTFVTPKLIGLSMYQAAKITSPHQINIRILSEKESAHVPAGTILNQKPAPGRIIKAHQPIFVTITKNAPDIISPNLLQQSQESIAKICQDTHLKYKIYEFEYNAPNQSCIAQLPQPKEIIHEKKIIVYCAKEKNNMYVMPDFNNQELGQVLHFLKDYTDKISIFFGSQKLIPPYQLNKKIVNQKPLAGSLISIHQPLNVHLEIT